MTKSRKNSVPTSDQRLEEALEEFRRILIETGRAERRDAIPPIDVDGRFFTGTAQVTYTAGGLSVTIDFRTLCRAMLNVGDSVFNSAFGPDGVTIEFPDGGSMSDVVGHYVGDSLRWVDGAAIWTLADYFMEMVLQGASFAAESCAEGLFKDAGMPFPQSFRKTIRDLAKNGAAGLLAVRIPSVGRGGANRMADIPADSLLIAFHHAIENVYPFWKDVQTRAARGDETWRGDAEKLPEYRKFTSAEKRHAETVLSILQTGRKINGGRPDAKRLAREHARLLVGMDSRSDSKLKTHEARGKRLACGLPEDGFAQSTD